MKNKKLGRKRIGKEHRITRSVRIEPKKLKLISKKHKTFQKWIDQQVNAELKIKKVPRLISNKHKIKIANHILSLLAKIS